MQSNMPDGRDAWQKDDVVQIRLGLDISWALPVAWPGSVYSLEIGIVGTERFLTIDDTHRDVVMAPSIPQQAGYTPEITRNVDFLA